MTVDELLAAEDAKIAEALRFAGLRVNSVYDLVNTKQAYAAAIPLLASMLREVTHPRLREGIARALTVTEARPIAKELVDAFRASSRESMPAEHAKWAIGNALSVAATDEVIEDIVGLMKDKDHGWSRGMLPRALSNTKKKRELAIAALIDALSDDELSCQAAVALAKLKAREAMEPLQRLAQHENRDIQKAALKALQRLETS
jgi:HEAT repeat protein